LLLRAQQEAESLRRQAYDEGLAQGKQQALAEAREEARRLLESVEKVVRAIRQTEQRWAAQAEKNVIRLSLRIARAVLGREAQTDQALLRESVRKALEKFTERSPLVVRLHPDDKAAWSSLAEELQGAYAPLRQIEVVADKAVERGGCVVESEEKTVDATPTAQLDAIEEELLSRLARGDLHPRKEANEPSPADTEQS